jgi:ribonuclease Z
MPAVYLEYNGSKMLFDCGEGTQRQMRIAKIPFMKLDKVFLSHFHADHCLGLGGLIQTMDLFRRSKKLEIYGPKGIHDVVEKVISTGHFILEGFDLEINEVNVKGVQKIVTDKQGSISCAPLDHNVPCLGFSFEENEKRPFLKQKALDLGVPEGRLFKALQQGESVKIGKTTIKPDQVLGKAIPGRKVTYIPDTRPCTMGIKLAKGSDVLIHESSFSHEIIESAVEGKHTTAKEAAQVAKKANVKSLYLNHISQRYANAEKLEKEAREVFLDSYVASDFQVIEL